jgi:hypothetical protein
MARVMGSDVPRSLRLAFVFALVTGTVVAGSPAHACSCAPIDLRERLPEVDGAFVGTFVQRDQISDQLATYTFDVERVIKGRFGQTAIVRTNAYGASCGIELLGGPRDGFLLTHASDGIWESDLCSQVSPDELLAFAPGEPPDPGVEPIGPGTVWPWWAASTLLGALVVGGVVLRARRARRRSAA